MPNMIRIIVLLVAVALFGSVPAQANAVNEQSNVYVSFSEAPNGFTQYCTENDPSDEFGYGECTEGNKAKFVQTKNKVTLNLEDDQTFMSGSLYYQDNKYAADGSPITTLSRAWNGTKAFKTKITIVVDGQKVKMFLKDAVVGVYDASVPA